MKKKILISIAIVAMLSLIITLAACDFVIIPEYRNDAPNTRYNADALTDTQLTTGVNTATLTTWSDVAEAVIPSVVCVFNYSDAEGNKLASTGSGFAVLAEEGNTYIVTNAHVVEGQVSLKIKDSNGNSYKVSLIGADAYTDLAVIMAENVTLPVVTIGDSAQVRIAEEVIAIGNPGGEEFSSSVTKGIISAKDRELSLTNGYLLKCFQTDAAINPGNSGGPLINSKGEVIGVNSAKISDTSYEGMGFSITTEEMLPIINDLLSTGSVSGRATLGVSGSMASQYPINIGSFWTYSFKDYYGSPDGFLVTTIYATEAAENAGLKEGDIITVFDGVNVTSVTTINGILQNKNVGDVVTMKIWRLKITTKGFREEYSGEELEITMTLTDYNEVVWSK